MHDEDLTNHPLGVNMQAFKNYSRQACLLECRARLLQEECHCLPYYFPNFAPLWNVSTSCGIDGIRCLANNSGNRVLPTAISAMGNLAGLRDLHKTQLRTEKLECNDLRSRSQGIRLMKWTDLT